MQNLPFYVYFTFGVTILITAWLLFKATHYSTPFLIVLVLWIVLQSILGFAGFYSDLLTMTTRFPLLIFPPLLFLVFQLIIRKGRLFIDDLDLPTLTLIHIIRIPVELVLFWLFIHKSVPQAMTFHGRNFDIFSGITAPVIYYFGFVKKTLGKKLILAWNFICLALLVNVVLNAVLSLPARYQHFGFEQPNIALGYFPFLFLPAFLVPAVLFSTLAAIRQLLKKSDG